MTENIILNDIIRLCATESIEYNHINPLMVILTYWKLSGDSSSRFRKWKCHLRAACYSAEMTKAQLTLPVTTKHHSPRYLLMFRRGRGGWISFLRHACLQRGKAILGYKTQNCQQYQITCDELWTIVASSGKNLDIVQNNQITALTSCQWWHSVENKRYCWVPLVKSQPGVI